MGEDLAFERQLYVLRRLVEKAVTRSGIPSRGDFYIPSLSCRTIVYKGMLNASQLSTSTRTCPTSASRAPSPWSTRASRPTPSPPGPRAHPYRYISHNGEINTLRGNINWMHARESSFRLRCSATI